MFLTLASLAFLLAGGLLGASTPPVQTRPGETVVCQDPFARHEPADNPCNALWLACGEQPVAGTPIECKDRRVIADGIAALPIPSIFQVCAAGATFHLMVSDTPAQQFHVSVYRISKDDPQRVDLVDDLTFPADDQACWRPGLSPGRYVLADSTGWGIVSTSRAFAIEIPK